MRRLALLLLLLSTALLSCGDDPADPHVVGSCQGWTDNQGNPYTGQCEAACMTPPMSFAESCDTAGRLNCPSFTFDGNVDGCCVEQAGTIRFFECAP